jgi:2-dehydro-3-deoxyphosphogluconate aldolase/(4S)-4-hydroxy-2-oxoglutarate aldolase
MTVEQARSALDAGANYVVSPTLIPDVVEFCRRMEIAVVPGAFTPTEIATAWQLGADVVKVFPASIGGPGYFKDLAGPLPGMRLMPSGGVDHETAPKFIRAGAFAVAVGGAVLGTNLIATGQFDRITANAGRFRDAVAIDPSPK